MESKLMKKAAGLSIPVVEVSILEAMKSTSNVPALSVIQRGNIAPWDCPDVFRFLKCLWFSLNLLCDVRCMLLRPGCKASWTRHGFRARCLLECRKVVMKKMTWHRLQFVFSLPTSFVLLSELLFPKLYLSKYSLIVGIIVKQKKIK